MTIIKTFEQQEKPTHSKKYIGICMFGIVCLVVLQIWANNTMAVYGNKFDKVSNLQRSLMLENQILENEIAELSSLSTIASESAKLGLVKAKNIEYLH